MSFCNYPCIWLLWFMTPIWITFKKFYGRLDKMVKIEGANSTDPI